MRKATPSTRPSPKTGAPLKKKKVRATNKVRPGKGPSKTSPTGKSRRISSSKTKAPKAKSPKVRGSKVEASKAKSRTRARQRRSPSAKPGAVGARTKHATKEPSHLRRWVGIFVVVALGGIIGSGFGIQKAVAAKRAPAAADAGAVSITTEAAITGDVPIYLSAIGAVTPVYTSSVTSQVTGIITQLHYEEGQLVHAGDALIDIDPRAFEAQLHQARGTLAKDTKVLSQARMDLARYQAAWDQKAITKQMLDDQEQIVMQDEGTVRADEGTVQYDEVQVSFCHITAPITGRAGLRLVDPGNIVQANGTSPLVVITQQDPMTVIFTIAEDDLASVQAQLQTETKLRVEAYDRTSEHLVGAGTLVAVDNQIDSTTGTVKLRALFDNHEGKLFPNQFVNAKLLVKTLHGLTLVPTSAIQHNGQDAFVYVVANETAQMRKVTPGPADSGRTSVDGVKPGELVASSSFEKLHPTTRVKSVGEGEAVDGGAPDGSP